VVEKVVRRMTPGQKIGAFLGSVGILAAVLVIGTVFSPGRALLLLENIIIGASVVVSVMIYRHTREEDRKLQKAAYVRDYTLAFFQHPELEETFFDIDHDKFTYSDDIIGKEKERRLLRLLDFFNSLGYSWDQGVIDVEDIDKTTLGYAVWRVHRDEQVGAFLKHIVEHDVKDLRIAEDADNPLAFQYFTKVGKKLNTLYQSYTNVERDPRGGVGSSDELT
jgi:hypothetical protein